VSLPSGYDEIWVRARVRTVDAGVGDRVGLRVGNGSVDTGINYIYSVYWQGAASGGAVSSIDTSFTSPVVAGNGAASGTFGDVQWNIYAPEETGYFHQMSVQGGYSDGTNHRTGHGSGRWKNGAVPIDILNLVGVSSPTFMKGSQLIVLGVTYG